MPSSSSLLPWKALRSLAPSLASALASVALGCVEASASAPGELGIEPVFADARVDFTRSRVEVPPLAYGMHASVYDNALHDPALPGLLEEGGLSLLRWPGGGYSDNYHWSTHTMTPFSDGNTGYLARGSDFGSFVSVIEGFGGTAMITVNYGSNLASDGPGEPLEAAAWVAYANGDPDDTRALGLDGSGNDWHTVGYWAELRAAAPIARDDGKNFLRIAHPAPLAIEHWEIGNEVFGNGYYGEALAFELDLHVPYDGTAREGNPLLSGATYGAGVVAYAEAMKAVDPDVKIGAVLNTPPRDYSWGPTWNADVLAECGHVIDFGSVHWYPTKSASEIVTLPPTELASMAQALRDDFERYGGDRASAIGIAMTELGGAPGHRLHREAPQSLAIFAADTYLTAVEQGFFNLDWLELHNETYLDEDTPELGPAYQGIRLAALLARPGDTLVEASSNRMPIVVHAARRADGGYGILIIDQQVPAAPVATVTLELTGVEPSRCEKYVLTAATQADPGVFSGPESFEPLASPLELEVPGYSITLLRCAAPT